MDGWEDLEIDEEEEEEEHEINEAARQRDGSDGGREEDDRLTSLALDEVEPFREFETNVVAVEGEEREGVSEWTRNHFVVDVDDSPRKEKRAPRRGGEELGSRRTSEGRRNEPEGKENARGLVRAEAASLERWPASSTAEDDDTQHHRNQQHQMYVPGPIGQLQRVWSSGKSTEAYLQTQKGGNQQNNRVVTTAATTTSFSRQSRARREMALIRAVEDETDFKSLPWRRAMNALDIQPCDVYSPTLSTPIGSVSDGGTNRKVGRLVGLVKQFELEADGNAFVILKDPSGSIGATVHSEVLRMEARLKIGSVLVLEKVSVFSAEERVHFLCITLDNILQHFL